MFTAGQYIRAKSLEEAYSLHKKGTCILGGMQWLKMGQGFYSKVIDLSDLHLSGITDEGDSYLVGAMTPLREMEESRELSSLTSGAMKEALRHIVGVQFRNLATLGGTVSGKYGFSDVLTMLLVLDSTVILYPHEELPLANYLEEPLGNRIVTGVRIRKENLSCRYASMRNTETDLPTLTCAMAKGDGGIRLAIGARPQIAKILTFPEGVSSDEMTGTALSSLSFSSNLRGSEDYRRHLAKVLIRRCWESMEGGEQ